MLSDEIRERLFLLVKQSMKRQNLSYIKVAKILSMSESGLKRIFQEKNCSMDRLIQICEVLDLDFKTLLEVWDQGFVKRKLVINEELDLYFSKNMHLFSLLRLIQTTDVQESEFELYGFSSGDVLKLKVALRSYNLLSDNMDLKHMKRVCLQFPVNAQTVQIVAKNWGLKFAAKVVEGKVPESSASVWAQELSKDDAIQLLEEIKLVCRKYEKISNIYRGLEKSPRPEFSMFVTSGFETPALPQMYVDSQL